MIPEDLRIGNWVQRIGFPYQIVAIKGIDIWVEAKGVILEYFLYDGFHPIPLDKEWLEKFGFNYSDFLESWSSVDGKISIEATDGGFIYDRFKIRYVHQLQNLVHALTEEYL